MVFNYNDGAGTAILYEESVWTGKKKLTVNGNEATMVSKNVYSVNNGGMQQTYTLKGNSLTGVQMTSNEGMTFEVLRKLSVLEWILCIIPLFLVILGGALGGAIAAVALVSNILIVRSVSNVFLKILVCLCIAAFAYGLYLLIGGVLFAALSSAI